MCWQKKTKNPHTQVLLLLLESLKLLSTCQKLPVSAKIAEAKYLLSCLPHQSDVETEKMLYNKALVKEIPHLSSGSLNNWNGWLLKLIKAHLSRQWTCLHTWL